VNSGSAIKAFITTRIGDVPFMFGIFVLVFITGFTTSNIPKISEIDGETAVFAGDLTADGAPEALVAESVAELGGLDCLVNNVGVAYQRSFEELTDRDWDEQWQLNVMSYVRAIRAAVPQMRERREGVIVNVSSTAGKRPSTSMPHYSVTKAAVLSLSRLVADLYAKDGIRCNVVCPGLIETPMSRRVREDTRIRARLAELQPLTGGFGTPEDVARAALYLATAPFVTGAVLTVDGGWTAR
jgi:2-keto-3-deoxy-L-fuconate dehydrogenase